MVLLEAGRVGSGATGHTTAKATALQSPRYARLAAEHGEDAAALAFLLAGPVTTIPAMTAVRAVLPGPVFRY